VTRTDRALAAWRRARSQPLTWILIAMIGLRVVGITWGLPGSDAWEDDGIAPRDFLVGTVETYTPGHFFTYPPVHLIGLTLLTAPVWGWALAHARSLAPPDVIAAMIAVPIGTTLTLVARAVSAFMSLGIVYALAKIGEELRGPRAGILIALTVGLNAPLVYYGHTSNLDVPYLFWASLSLLELVRVMVHVDPKRMRRAFVLAALAIGTKDQAYALFLLGVPLAFGLWFATDARARKSAKGLARALAISAVLALVLLLLLDGAITNPSGFRQRVAFLLGPASQEHAYYAATWEGRFQILRGLALGFDRFYPWPFAPLVVLGIGAHIARARKDDERGRLAAGLLPLFAALSFVVCFNFAARRTEHRFALPEMLLAGVYAGLALDSLLEACRTAWAKRVAVAALVPIFGWALFGCAAVDAVLVLDPRYEAEAWLEQQVRPGDTIEVYGTNAYLPRLPHEARVSRVDVLPLSKRNPLPGVTEVESRFGDVEARHPRFIVVPEAWVWKYMNGAPPAGLVLAPQHAAWQHDRDSTEYFHALHEERLAYRRAHVAAWSSTFWPRLDLHQSTGHEIRIFERKPL
jgi:hypothetical protein